MLASLLPGLRDLRTPLATGYLWLLAFWLVFHDAIPTSADQATGPFKSLYELSGLLGGSAILATISFLAYLTGSMLVVNFTENFRPYIRGPGASDVSPFGIYTLSRRIHINSATQLYDQLLTLVHNTFPDLPPNRGDNHSTIEYSKALQNADDIPLALPWTRDLYNPRLLNLNEAIVIKIVKEMPAVGVQLQAQHPSYWDTFDRHVSEGQFRFAIAPPLVALVIILAYQSSWWWLLALGVPIYILFLGTRQYLQATSTLVQALVLEMVRPPVFLRLNAAISRGPSES